MQVDREVSLATKRSSYWSSRYGEGCALEGGNYTESKRAPIRNPHDELEKRTVGPGNSRDGAAHGKQLGEEDARALIFLILIVVLKFWGLALQGA